LCFALACSQALTEARHVLPRYTDSEPAAPVVIAIVATIFLLMIAGTTMRLRTSKGVRWCVTAGTLTYPLYLVHQYSGGRLIELQRGYMPPTLTLVMTIGVTLLMAWLIHRFVERPAAKPLRLATERLLLHVSRMMDSRAFEHREPSVPLAAD
jgi:peptidoglycan/LPS O-acetylase OafA/YrhL